MSLRTSEQLRAARALLGWAQKDIAERSGVSLPTVKRLEVGEGAMNTRVETVDRLQRAFEEAGVIFIAADDAGGPGVRLRSAG